MTFCILHNFDTNEGGLDTQGNATCPGCNTDMNDKRLFSCENCGELINKKQRLCMKVKTNSGKTKCIYCTRCSHCGVNWISWQYRPERLCQKCGDRKQKIIKLNQIEVKSDSEEEEENLQREIAELYEERRREENNYEDGLKRLKEEFKLRVNKINATIGKRFRRRDRIKLKRALRLKEIEERNKLLPALNVIKSSLKDITKNM